MTNINLSTFGFPNAGTPSNETERRQRFKLEFITEVMRVYNKALIFKDKHMIRPIAGKKGAEFPIAGRATAGYHTPGTPRLGNQNIPVTDIIINVDGLLHSHVTIADIDQAMSHIDYRSIFTEEMAYALAKQYDELVARMLVKSSRIASPNAHMPSGFYEWSANAGTDAAVLRGLIEKASEKFDTNDIREHDRFGAVRAPQWHLLARHDALYNRDNGITDGNRSKLMLPPIAGVNISMSNQVPNTNVVANDAQQLNDYTGDFTNTVGLVWQKAAAGSVHLKEPEMKMTGEEYDAMYAATLIVVQQATGHGVLRTDSAVELMKDNASADPRA